MSQNFLPYLILHQVFWSWIWILSAFIFSCALGSNSTNFAIRHYLELGCSPLLCDGNVQAYHCPFETLDNSTGQKCIYKGQLINIGEKIPDSGCNFACTCIKDRFQNQAGFICAVADCFEFAPGDNKCIYQYKLGGCCSVKQVCDPEKIKKLTKCKVGSKTYLDGQRFYPEGSCVECICHKGFTGKLVAPYCKIVDCGIERYAQDMIFSRCAPIYYREYTCCPIGWECYKSGQKIIRDALNQNSTNKYQCTFGKEKLNIGDKIVSEDPCVTCSCVYPPLATCIRKLDCISP